MAKMLNAIGLMSGTSLDGIDAALIKSDGEKVLDSGHSFTMPYGSRLHEKLRSVALRKSVNKLALLRIERDITIAHAEAVTKLLEKSGIKNSEVDLIGFHGQTFAHHPEEGITWQIGNPALLAELTGINVISDFRRRDVAAGGQGAPLVPIFHAAIAGDMKVPVAILNIGGVANLTYIERAEGSLKILGFDTGPGNALLDDWINQHTDKRYDEDGKIAKNGIVNEKILNELLGDQYFAKIPPKSLDRDHFTDNIIAKFGGKQAPHRRASDPVAIDVPAFSLSTEDGAATLSAFTVMSVAKAVQFLPSEPKKWFVCGGGRHNKSIMSGLQEKLKGEVQKIEELGFNGDTLEAQAFGFLAVRSYLGMSLSLPETTGVKRLVTGGAFYRA